MTTQHLPFHSFLVLFDKPSLTCANRSLHSCVSELFTCKTHRQQWMFIVVLGMNGTLTKREATSGCRVSRLTVPNTERSVCHWSHPGEPVSICGMASLRVQSTVDGFVESSNSPTALNVHHGHQAAGASRSDPMFAFIMASIWFVCGENAVFKSSFIVILHYVPQICKIAMDGQLPLWGNLSLRCVFFVDGGNKLEHLEETQAKMGRTCRVRFRKIPGC